MVLSRLRLLWYPNNVRQPPGYFHLGEFVDEEREAKLRAGAAQGVNSKIAVDTRTKP